MKYKGIELNEFKSDKPILFDPPKKMLVWDGLSTHPYEKPVEAYLPSHNSPAICQSSTWGHCAEIPEEPKPRRATNLELMEWLAKGNGCGRNIKGSIVWSEYDFEYDVVNQTCDENIRIRKWSDTEWREPTIDYMGLAK